MSWKNIGAAGLMAMVGILGNSSFAQDLRSQQTAIEKDIAALNQQISSKQQQANALRNRPSPEQAELAAAQKALNDARAEAKANPSSENEGKARNAEFKFKLAQIKYDKAHGEVETLSDEIDRLKQQLASKQQQIKDLGKQTAEPQVDPQQQQKLADERNKRQQQEQELARTKQEADAARKEIERLKAALASKEAAEAKAQAAAPAATPAPAPAPVAVAAGKPDAAKPAATGSSNVIKLDSQQAVLHALQDFAQRTAGADARRTINQTLYVKSPNVAATNKDKITLKGLGNNQYRGSNSIPAGTYEAVLGFNRWPVTFSASEAGDLVFLLDYSDEKNPRLTIYNSTLEGGK
jgi:hypothetical protein